MPQREKIDGDSPPLVHCPVLAVYNTWYNPIIMTATIQLFLLLGIIIFAAKAGGLISTKLGQPAVLGELLMGLILGPTALDILAWTSFADGHAGEVIVQIGELGVIFLMFIAGLEVDLGELLKSSRVAAFAGTLGVIVPLILGGLIALAFNHPFLNSIFIGLVLTATSVSISAQTLLELGKLRSKEGMTLLGAAVFDDVLVILLLSIFLAIIAEGGANVANILIVVLRMAGFVIGATLVSIYIIPRLINWVDSLPVSEGVMALTIIVILFYAWSAQVVGEIAAITGAFLAGLAFSRTSMRHVIQQGMHTLTYAFFVPIFLISIGLKANARALDAPGIGFAIAIILIAIIGKILGSGLGARIGGFGMPESLRVGVGMISRGEVGLIVAAIGLERGLIDQTIFSAMIVMVLATTLVTPFFLRWVFPKGATHG